MKNQESLASEAVPILFSLAVGRICAFGGSAELPPESGDPDELVDSAGDLDLATGFWTPLPRMPYKVDAPFAFLLSEKER